MPEQGHQADADRDPDRGQHGGEAHRGSDVAPLRGQTALRQDDDEGGESQSLGEVWIVERDTERTIGAEQHAQAQEEQK